MSKLCLVILLWLTGRLLDSLICSFSFVIQSQFLVKKPFGTTDPTTGSRLCPGHGRMQSKFAIMTRHQEEEKTVIQNPNNNTTTSRHEAATRTVSSRKLYPPPSLLRNGTLPLGDSLHSLYYEVYGTSNNTTLSNKDIQTKKGKIALSLHGGPGAGCFPKHAQFFDPERYHRVILFDQRGCGRSKPRGETRLNTLQLLVQDIEVLRTHLELDAFDVVLGGSWGSTLALAYAQSFPRRVGSIVLRGVCLFRSQEIDWLFGNQLDNGNHDYDFKGDDDTIIKDGKIVCISNNKELACEWEKFVNGVDKMNNDADDDNQADNDDYDKGDGTRRILYKYYNALLGSDPVARAMAARSWFQWEMSVASLPVESNGEKDDLGDILVWNGARRIWIGKHYHGNQVVERQQQYHKTSLDFLRKWPKSIICRPSSRQIAIQPVISQRFIRLDAKDKLQTNTHEEAAAAAAEKFIPAQAMLTCFYSVNQEFIMEHFNLLKKENIDRIRHIPCIVVQGAKDLICPPDSALDLVEAWPEMQCRIVTEGKHSMYDPKIMSELIQATDDVADILSNT